MPRLVPLLVLLSLVATSAANPAVWFDPDRGCGRGEVFVRTGRVADLPGCSGTLPPAAPPVEGILHDAKRALVDADRLLDRGAVDSVDALLDGATLRLATVTAPHPEMPDRLTSARPLYEQALVRLRDRRRFVPRLGRLRDAHRAAVDAGRTMTAREREGGAADTVRLARVCLSELAEARAAGINFTTPVELTRDRQRPLDDAMADCEAARAAAEPLARAQEIALRTRRAEWRKAMRGDRLKVFDAHPDALPECAATSRGARATASAKEWCYTTSAGREVYTFQGNRLLRR
ncbi:MAG: hypothetical protein EXR72_16855 [Myxococcales bacterium]|nr:hypothetical protein [Myxococcales bacterium]